MVTRHGITRQLAARLPV